MSTEILIALWSNVRVAVFVGALFAGGIALLMGAFGLGARAEENDDAAALCLGIFRKAAVTLLVLAPIACIPSMDDLWKVRIGLIKYQLAAPENVRAATETIERIGKKLECKYLGGCEEKK